MYRLSDDTAIIFTTDFFTPIVDDPFDYGSIAAANAMSDVYAMGGEVVMALNIACFPKDMDDAVIREILRGGALKVREAGGAIVGGHTIDDDEPKYGLAVMGMAHPDRLVDKSGGRPGDLLVLTKPLGSGLITTALKGEAAEPEHVVSAVESMITLNRSAARCMRDAGCVSATDVTGFGLIGHALEIATHSRVRLRIRTDNLPLLPGTLDYAGMWLFPAGANHNRSAFECRVRFAENLPEEFRMMLFTPETSGGLLICVASDRLNLLQRLMNETDREIWVIGEIRTGEGLEFVTG